MGNTRALKVDENCDENPFEGEYCIRVDYLDHIGWAGIFWQNPANDWGEKPGGRALNEIYLPAFEAAVKDAGVWSVMTAYNKADGACPANPAASTTSAKKPPTPTRCWFSPARKWATARRWNAKAPTAPAARRHDGRPK